jgi:hypothetical protein
MLLFLRRHLGAALRFYRSVAPFSLGVTLVMAGLLLPFRHEPNYGVPLLLKLLTWPALPYLQERMRPHHRWWWHNLGYTRRQLWVSAFGVDMLVFALILYVVFA